MSEVKRYDLDGYGGGMVLSVDGAWYHMYDYDALAAEFERLRLDNLSKNGSMKAFGEQIAALQRAVKNRDKLKARAEAERDAALAELAALKGGREAVATKWGHGVQGVPPYGFTCHADRRDQWIAEGKEVYVMETDPPAQASAWVPEVEDWSVFIGYLIDKYEGHEIAEERLQGWLSEMLRDPHYGALFRREKVNAGQPSPIALAIEAAEEEHGSLRCAAKALGIDPGYLSRLASGEKTNPSNKVLAALGLERVTMYRAAAPTPGASDGKEEA